MYSSFCYLTKIVKEFLTSVSILSLQNACTNSSGPIMLRRSCKTSNSDVNKMLFLFCICASSCVCIHPIVMDLHVHESTTVLGTQNNQKVQAIIGKYTFVSVATHQFYVCQLLCKIDRAWTDLHDVSLQTKKKKNAFF